MSFNPGLKIGQILKNNELVEIFKCGNMGGMRRSKATNTLVIVIDHTKGLYKDKWKGGVLHYTGMGKVGDKIFIGVKTQPLQIVVTTEWTFTYLK